MAFTRRFYFFDKEALKPTGTTNVLNILKDVKVSCGTSGPNLLWFGDEEGFMRAFDRNFTCSTFRAYEGIVRLCKQMKQQDLLITVGVEFEEKIKIWDTAKWEKDSSPFCYRIVKAGGGSVGNSPVTCIEVMESLNFMFVGYSNGVIQMFKGDITRDRSSKQSIVKQCGRPITNFGALPHENGVKLFVSTESSIFCLVISHKDKVNNIVEIPLDQFGASIGCAVAVESQTMSPSHMPFITACKDAIYFYQCDSRGPCLGVEGEKYSLLNFKSSYLLVLRPTSAALGQASGRSAIMTTSSETTSGNNVLSGFITKGNPSLLPPRGSHQITIFDYVNKFIVGEFQLSDVKLILYEWGKLFILHGVENKIVCLVEKETRAKLDILFAKKSYNTAIEIAKSLQFDEERMAELFMRYADHLYRSKDYDGAVQEYIKTIGKLEPSYVIQKFLDTSRIRNLTAYLQALHKARLATKDHTTLLLNCYSKQREEENLDRFIKDANDMEFDVETAIRVLRQSGMQEQAQSLAQKFQHHDWYLRIVIEDRKLYREALTYIKGLGFDQAMPSIVKYGNVLMEHHPQDTAAVLDALCQSSYSEHIHVSDFMQIFVNNRLGLMAFLEKYIEKTNVQDLVQGVVDTLLELYLYSLEVLQTASTAGTDEANANISIESVKGKVLRILENHQMPYNPLKQLMLCRQRNFIPGYLHLCARTDNYKLIMEHHIQSENYDEIINTCKTYGSERPLLWIDALEYFGRRKDSTQYLKEVVEVIDEQNIMPPLSVIHRLVHEDTHCTLASIKNYLLRHLEKSQTALSAFEKTIMTYKRDTDANHALISRLSNNPTKFQMQKCSVCHQPLDLPSVHFLCEHSFHLQCFESYAENENECPCCVASNMEIKAEIEAWNLQSKSKSSFEQPQSLTDAWHMAYEGMNRAFVNKNPVTENPTAGKFAATTSASTTDSSTIPSKASEMISGKSKESSGGAALSYNSSGYVGNVATSASAARGFNGTAKVEQVVASAGQTISEATAAATNLASGLFSHVKESFNLSGMQAASGGRTTTPQTVATKVASSTAAASSPINKRKENNPFAQVAPSKVSANPFEEEEQPSSSGGFNPFELEYPDDLNPFQ